jgi:hypothetical protein
MGTAFGWLPWLTQNYASVGIDKLHGGYKQGGSYYSQSWSWLVQRHTPNSKYFYSMPRKDTMPKAALMGYMAEAHPHEAWGYTGSAKTYENIPQNIYYFSNNGYGSKDGTGQIIGLYLGSGGARRWAYGGGTSWDNAIYNFLNNGWSPSKAIDHYSSTYAELSKDGTGLKMRFDQRPKRAESGGYLVGPSHGLGGIPLEAEGGEYIINKNSVSSLGKDYLDFINENGKLPFMSYALGGYVEDGDFDDNGVGLAEVNTDSEDVKSLLLQLIKAIKEGDKDIVDALGEIEPDFDVSVYTDMDGEFEAKISAFKAELRERQRRGLDFTDL